ncbi:hypothetical protein V5O48_007862 [Marasmius crinis-equi]|uniref:Uncharacterized protein n=1 Tax=Marasmius crinis-equi TaxID=585013 RepID=A0ABR3FG90_9AGAR
MNIIYKVVDSVFGGTKESEPENTASPSSYSTASREQEPSGSMTQRNKQKPQSQSHGKSGSRRQPEQKSRRLSQRFSGHFGAHRDVKPEERPSGKEVESGDKEPNREAELLRRAEAAEAECRTQMEKYQKASANAAELQERLGKAEKERERVKDQAKAQATDLQKRLETRNSDVERARNSYSELSSRTDAMRREAERKRDEYLSLQNHCESLTSTYNKLNTDKQTLESEYKRLKSHFDNQSGELQQLKAKYDAQQTLLAQRTKELQEAQAYLTSTRSSSGADIIRMVGSLNTEIMQTAASITDALHFEELALTRSPDELQVLAQKQLGRMLTQETMSGLVHHPSGDDLDIIIQSTLQYIMVGHCRDLINSWSENDAASQYLDDIYTDIRKQNPSSVAGRWRAMTKAHTKYSRYALLENSTTTRLVEDVKSVIRRWARILDKAVQAEIARIIEMKVGTVVNQAMQIDKILGSDVVSEDWEVFYTPSGTAFDGTSMEDPLRAPAASGSSAGTNDSTGVVICTTDLGLKRRDEKAEDKSSGWQVMTKAKVLLDTAFER